MFISKGSYGYGEPKNVIAASVGKSALAVAGLQSTWFHVSPYRAVNIILGQFGTTYRHGTVFAPKHCLYRKDATDMESLNI